MQPLSVWVLVNVTVPKSADLVFAFGCTLTDVTAASVCMGAY